MAGSTLSTSRLSQKRSSSRSEWNKKVLRWPNEGMMVNLTPSFLILMTYVFHLSLLRYFINKCSAYHSFLLGVGVLVVDQPVDCGLQICLHVCLLLVSEFQKQVGVVVVILYVQLYLFENLALDVLANLFLFVPSGLQAFVEGLILAAHEYNKFEVLNREDISTVEVEKQPSCSNIIVCGNVVDQPLLTELGHVELLIPVLVELVVDDELADGDVGEVERLVKQLAESGLSGSRSAGDEDVWGFAADGLLLDHCCRMIIQQSRSECVIAFIHQGSKLPVPLAFEVHQPVDL